MIGQMNNRNKSFAVFPSPPFPLTPTLLPILLLERKIYIRRNEEVRRSFREVYRRIRIYGGVFSFFFFFNVGTPPRGKRTKGVVITAMFSSLSLPSSPVFSTAWRIPWPSFFLYTDHAFHFPTSFYRFPIST